MGALGIRNHFFSQHHSRDAGVSAVPRTCPNRTYCKSWGDGGMGVGALGIRNRFFSTLESPGTNLAGCCSWTFLPVSHCVNASSVRSLWRFPIHSFLPSSMCRSPGLPRSSQPVVIARKISTKISARYLDEDLSEDLSRRLKDPRSDT